MRHIDIKKKKTSFFNGKRDKAFPLEDGAERMPILFFKGRRIENFFTEDSGLYLIQEDVETGDKRRRFVKRVRSWDSVSSRVVRDYREHRKSENDFLYRRFKSGRDSMMREIESASDGMLRQFSFSRIWNMSIAVAMLFGMFSMTMIYRYLGQGASAGVVDIAAVQPPVERSIGKTGDSLEDEGDSYTRHFIEEALNEKGGDLESEIRNMVKGYPIEEMVPYIAEKDRIVAAFLVGIAKKESNWGKRVPLLNGQDCYNYWGYRGIRRLMGTGGHTCFNSRKDAVDTVAKRLKWLIENEELDTPEKMVIWKCGSDCNVTGGWAAANKWIDDVNMYFKKLSEE